MLAPWLAVLCLKGRGRNSPSLAWMDVRGWWSWGDPGFVNSALDGRLHVWNKAGASCRKRPTLGRDLHQHFQEIQSGHWPPGTSRTWDDTTTMRDTMTLPGKHYHAFWSPGCLLLSTVPWTTGSHLIPSFPSLLPYTLTLSLSFFFSNDFMVQFHYLGFLYPLPQIPTS